MGVRMTAEDINIALIKSIVDTKKDLLILFKGEEPILTNKSFNNFFSVSSLEDYKRNYGGVLDSFVPHPDYFYKDKVEAGKTWFEAILKLDEMDRIVSMISSSFNPCAFSVGIDRSIEDYSIVTFTDITQDLIKRIMIENNANIDKKSGAYDKEYFIHVSKSFEDAASFNEKILGSILISVDANENPNFANDEEALKGFVNNVKSSIRKDDMLVYWEDGNFLLVFLVESKENAQQMLNKLINLVESSTMRSLGCKLNLAFQKEKESIAALIKRVQP